jgi:hypothetical protein
MKAIVQDAYGATDVLQLRDIDKPVVKDDELLIRVWIGVDRGPPPNWVLSTSTSEGGRR